MKNKILVSVWVPMIEQEYELFIPVNRRLGIIKKLIVLSIIELSDNNYKVNNDFKLLDNENNVLNDSEYVINTNIRNGSKLILL